MTYQTCLYSTRPTPQTRVPAAGCAWSSVFTLPEDDLPLDPRTWKRSEVARWVSSRGGLPERFPMNGKALCLMSKDMFCARVPENGQELHQEFRKRLAKALALQDLLEKITPK